MLNCKCKKLNLISCEGYQMYSCNDCGIFQCPYPDVCWSCYNLSLVYISKHKYFCKNCEAIMCQSFDINTEMYYYSEVGCDNTLPEKYEIKYNIKNNYLKYRDYNFEYEINKIIRPITIDALKKDALKKRNY